MPIHTSPPTYSQRLKRHSKSAAEVSELLPYLTTPKAHFDVFQGMGRAFFRVTVARTAKVLSLMDGLMASREKRFLQPKTVY